MKTHYTFEPGDRVITPYGAATVDKVEAGRCLVIYDFHYSFGSRKPAELEESATWYRQDQLRPETSEA